MCSGNGGLRRRKILFFRGSGVDRAPYRVPSFERLEQRLALSGAGVDDGGSDSSDSMSVQNALPHAEFHVLALAVVGTPMTPFEQSSEIRLPGLTASDRITAMPSHGSITVNDQGQLIFTANSTGLFWNEFSYESTRDGLVWDYDVSVWAIPQWIPLPSAVEMTDVRLGGDPSNFPFDCSELPLFTSMIAPQEAAADNTATLVTAPLYGTVTHGDAPAMLDLHYDPSFVGYDRMTVHVHLVTPDSYPGHIQFYDGDVVVVYGINIGDQAPWNPPTPLDQLGAGTPQNPVLLGLINNEFRPVAPPAQTDDFQANDSGSDDVDSSMLLSLVASDSQPTLTSTNLPTGDSMATQSMLIATTTSGAAAASATPAAPTSAPAAIDLALSQTSTGADPNSNNVASWAPTFDALSGLD
jgi:hypothetical protein